MSTEQQETVPAQQEEPKPEEPKPEEPKPDEPKPVEPQQEQPKAEEPKPEETKKEEPVKSKPAKPPVDYQTVKSGFVDRQGLLWKKWNHQWMTLDEGGSVLRWYKNEQRGGFDGQLYMKFCADVSEPKAETTTTWPPETTDRCFVVCSPYRAYFLVAENAEEKTDWMQKLNAAKDEFNKEGRKVISTALISIEAATTMLQATADQTEAETNKTLGEQGTTTTQIEKDLNKAADDTQKEVDKELKKDESAVVKEVDKAAKELEKDVEKADKEAEKEVDKASKELEKDADQAIKEVEQDVEAKGESTQVTVQAEVQEPEEKPTEGGEESKPEGGD